MSPIVLRRTFPVLITVKTNNNYAVSLTDVSANFFGKGSEPRGPEFPGYVNVGCTRVVEPPAISSNPHGEVTGDNCGLMPKGLAMLRNQRRYCLRCALPVPRKIMNRTQQRGQLQAITTNNQ
jgi:hypothetical protein